MAHRVTLIPGDGTGPELTEATRRVLEATGVELRLGRPPGGRRRHGGGGHTASRGDARVGEGERRRAQGADHDADRHRLPLRQRRAAARARAVRMPAPVQVLRGRPLALRGRRPRHRPREHRGPLRGDRVRGRAASTPSASSTTLNAPPGEADRRRLGHLGEADQRRSVGADRPLRVRVRAANTAAARSPA